MKKFVMLQEYIFNAKCIKSIERRAETLVVALTDERFPTFVTYKSTQEAADAFAQAWAELSKEGE